ncbi:MAG: helix-turn-helix domain-containing protein [Minwuia sp.]|uniref:helix-turn-helix domain-containing protein n=1 Tax=Minwuia sp. TaxID=2493630 RepID=UPI003A89D605
MNLRPNTGGRQVAIQSFDISDSPVPARLGAWTEILYDTFYPLDLISRDAEFSFGKLNILDIPGIRFGTIDSAPMSVFRRRQHLSQSGGDFYYIPLPMKAPLYLRQHGREARIEPGDFAIVATADMYQYEQNTENRLATLRIDGPLMRERVPLIDDLVARTCDGHAPLVQVFVDFVHSIMRQSSRLDHESAAAMTPHLLDLLALAVTAPVDAMKSSESSVRLAHLRRIMRMIEDRLDDETLGPGMLAKELGLSERYIQKMFADRGETLSGTIRARRIATAQRRLIDPTRRSSSIATIAFSVGYSDPAHFSRIFRSIVGLSPSEYRDGRRMDDGKA